MAAIAVVSVHDDAGRVALAGHTDIADAALNAEKTLHAGLAKLGSSPRSLQKSSLAAEMNQALAAVQELKGKLPSDSAANAAYTGTPIKNHARHAKGSRGRSARLQSKAAAAHPEAQDTVQKNLAKVRIAAQHVKTDSAVVGDLPDGDNKLVRDELRKMVEVAKRLSSEVHTLPSSSKYASERLQRKLGAVAHAARAMKKAANEEDAARQRVVAHELEVRKQKLAEAEEEEMAAVRAAKEAIAAERLAVKKRNEAAADEAAAHERRVAARRARAIASRGEEGKKAMQEASDSVFPKGITASAAPKSAARDTKHSKTGEFDKYAPSKAAVAGECTETIAKYGCGGLMAENPCLAFCGTDNDVRRAARDRRAGALKPVETGYAVHDRTGYFATGQDRDTYVDSVYGDRYDPSTYSHERKGFYVSKGAGRSSLLAPGDENGDFTDVAADGPDLKNEQSTEGLGSAHAEWMKEKAALQVG